MKLKEYLDALRIKENTVVLIQLNKGYFGHVVATTGNITQYWSAAADRNMQENIMDPDDAWNYQHRKVFHQPVDDQIKSLKNYFDCEYESMTPIINPSNVKVFRENDPDEDHFLGEPLMVEWDVDKIVNREYANEFFGNVLLLNILVK